MAKRPLTVSIKTTDGKEIKSGTVDEVLSGNLPPIVNETSPTNDAAQDVPVNVAVEVANASD